MFMGTGVSAGEVRRPHTLCAAAESAPCSCSGTQGSSPSRFAWWEYDLSRISVCRSVSRRCTLTCSRTAGRHCGYIFPDIIKPLKD